VAEVEVAVLVTVAVVFVPVMVVAVFVETVVIVPVVVVVLSKHLTKSVGHDLSSSSANATQMYRSVFPKVLAVLQKPFVSPRQSSDEHDKGAAVSVEVDVNSVLVPVTSCPKHGTNDAGHLRRVGSPS
jgi:hypothetical protein